MSDDHIMFADLKFNSTKDIKNVVELNAALILKDLEEVAKEMKS